MSVPNQIRDGDWTIATQDGPATWSLPFQSKGDTQSFEYKAKFKQYAANYTPLKNPLNGLVTPPITPHETIQTISVTRGGASVTAYLVEESDTTDEGCGILSFTRTYASLPSTRTEQSTLTYPFQFISTTLTFDWTSPPVAPEVAELPLLVNADIVYEYSLAKPAITYAPKVYSVFNKLVYVGTYVPLGSNYFVAEDSAIELYRGFFYQKRTPYIYWSQFH
jgi:hypothetical protein